MRTFKNKRLCIALGIVLAAILVCAAAFAVYVNIYYHVEPAAVQAMASAEAVSVYELRDGVTVFAPEEPLAGFIFYGIQEQFPEIGRWYIGGHSLGGAMAASYATSHAGELDGLVLLAAYSTQNLSNSGLAVLSVYGSEDGVLDMEKYEQYRSNLPADTVEVVIDGGCHAGFGRYGAQDGDGTPTISSNEQIARTAEEIAQIAG